MKMRKFILYILLLLAFVSCRTIDTFSIDYLLPADVSFPPSVKTIGVVNNTLNSSFTDDIKRINDNNSAYSDVIAVLEGDGKLAAEELANNVANGNYFESVVICDSALRANDLIARESKLGREEVKELADNLNVDIILALERVKLYLKRGVVYYPEASFPENTVDATVRTVACVYLPNRAEPLVTLSDTDSIYWTGTWSVNEEMIKEASVFAATFPIKHILPTWKSVTRYYYAGESVEMRDAAVCIREESWDDALALWKAVYAKKSEKGKMRAAHNIALYYEIKDNLEEAKTWLEKAMAIAEKKVKKNEKGEIVETTQDYILITLYYSDLMTRIGNLSKLNIQMQRFDSNF